MLHYESSKKLQQLEAEAATAADRHGVGDRRSRVEAARSAALMDEEIEARFPKALRPPYDPTVSEIVAYNRMTILNIGTGRSVADTARRCRAMAEQGASASPLAAVDSSVVGAVGKEGYAALHLQGGQAQEQRRGD